MLDLAKYIGKEYDKYDCFDLVKDFYRDHFNLDLSNYWEHGNTGGRKQTQALIYSSKVDFVKTEEPRIGDIVVVNLYGVSCHVGIYIDKQILHSIRGVGSCIEPIKKYARMLDGYYRPKVLG